MNLGRYVLTWAELWGAIKGLQVAWEHGFRRVMLQVDSLAVTQLIQGIEHPVHQNAMEVLDIQELIDRIGRLRSVIDLERRIKLLTSSLALVFIFPLGFTRSRLRTLVMAIFFIMIVLC
ncbi:hypothetical protein LINPERHAP2_LOCUS40254 [Linum perenne]